MSCATEQFSGLFLVGISIFVAVVVTLACTVILVVAASGDVE